jgi:hypothetical protein
VPIIVNAAMSAIVPVVPVVNLSGLVKNYICKMRLHLITVAALALLVDAANAIAQTSFDSERRLSLDAADIFVVTEGTIVEENVHVDPESGYVPEILAWFTRIV